jgi:manganese-dependent inorganic pyrophosphatase
MKEKVYVFGHKNPDSDSICSSLAYSVLKNKIEGDEKEFIPCRLGSLNPQTEYILNSLDENAPLFLPDVYSRVKDLMTKNVLTVEEHEPLLTPVKIVQESRIRIIPVTDDSKKLKGMITLFSLNNHLLNVTAPKDQLTTSLSTYNLVKTLNGVVLSGIASKKIFKAEFLVSVMGSYSFSKDLNKQKVENTVLFTSDRNDIILTAIDKGVKTIVITGGKKPNVEAVAEAKEKDILIICTEFSITQALNIGKLSIPAGLAIEKGDISIHMDTLKGDAKKKLLSSRHRGFVVVDDNDKITGIITRSDMLKSVKKKVILMDHNESGQSVSGLNDAEILEVVDHHRIGNFSTEKPITYLCRPCGSTCTIVASLFNSYGVKPDKKTATLMLAGILSDTIMFKSPTCTEEDKNTAKQLASIAGVDMKQFGIDIFNNSSKLAGRKDKELVTADMKVFSESRFVFSISQIEVVGFEEISGRYEKLLQQLETLKSANGYFFSAMMITDIVSGDSIILYSGDKAVISATGFKCETQGVYLANGILSRKKQLLPLLLSIVKEINGS